jgi:hypothetical protein
MPCRDDGASDDDDEGLGCQDNIVPSSEGTSDTELASMFMPSHKAQQDSEARTPALQAEVESTRPPALRVEGEGSPSATVARTDATKAIGGGGN